MKFNLRLAITILTLFLLFSCQQKTSKNQSVNIDSIVNVKVQQAKDEIKEEAQREAEERVRKEEATKQNEAKSEGKEKERTEQTSEDAGARQQKEYARPSGGTLKDREMRYYYDQGYDFGSHNVFSKMDDEFMRNAFMVVVTQHDMSHANNQMLFNSFMAGVKQGRKERKELEN